MLQTSTSEEELRSLIASCTSPTLESPPLDPILTPRSYFRGAIPADLTIIGEAPGKNEIRASKPFVGRAGIFLEDALARLNFDISSIFFTNACCFLPPRTPPTPTPEEVANCAAHMNLSLQLADAPYLLVLGATATHAIFGPFPSFQHRRSRFTQHTVGDHTTLAFVTYHPGAAIRNTHLADLFREDLSILKAQMDQDPLLKDSS